MPYIYFRYRGYVCISEISLSIESLFYNNEKNLSAKNGYDQVYFVTNNIKLVSLMLIPLCMQHIIIMAN